MNHPSELAPRDAPRRTERTLPSFRYDLVIKVTATGRYSATITNGLHWAEVQSYSPVRAAKGAVSRFTDRFKEDLA